jgi:hypothetical protein
MYGAVVRVHVLTTTQTLLVLRVRASTRETEAEGTGREIGTVRLARGRTIEED